MLVELTMRISLLFRKEIAMAFLIISGIIGFVIGVIVTSIAHSEPDPFRHLTFYGPEEDSDGWLN